MRLVFWQNQQAFYQSAHIRALAEHPIEEVIWVAAEQISADRQKQGWFVPDSGKATSIIAPDSQTMDALLKKDPKNSIHIFTGIGAFPMVKEAFHRCLPTGARMGLLVENRDERGWRWLGRYLLYRSDYLRFGKRLDFVLVMGFTGRVGGQQFYRKCGFPNEKLIPYGYFVDPDKPPAPRHVTPEQPVKLIYIGQFIHRKGLDILLNALTGLSDLNWQCSLIGAGEREEWLRTFCQENRLTDRVHIHPPMPNEKAMQCISESDVLLLPSRFDGWGVVVNEALVRGVPVICSERCGASDLVLNAAWRGDIFPTDSVEGLQSVLRRRIAQGPLTMEQSQRIADWAKCITGESAANYMLSALASRAKKQEIPTPPWLC